MNNYNDLCQDYIRTTMELEELQKRVAKATEFFQILVDIEPTIINGKMIQKGIDILNDEEYKKMRRHR
jgi:hypothetical protein